MYARLETRAPVSSPVRENASFRRRDGSVVDIGCWESRTRMAGIGHVLTITDPVSTARPA
jgi:hypothetical protein